jgi:SAM-dependent methyltransferase
MASEASRLRSTFDQVALLYDQARPGYPQALFDDIVSYSAIPPAGRILEIGCGTGQATVPLAQRGYHIVAVELGASLAAVAQRNLESYPQVEIQVGDFEELGLPEQHFDLAISATAFHWIDPVIGYPKIAGALRPHGTIALFWNKHVWSERSQDCFAEIQEVYFREAPAITTEDDWVMPRAEDVTEPVIAQMERTGLYGPVTVSRYVWDQAYDAVSYIDVLNTYSGHRDLDPAIRENLFAGIREVIDSQYDGQIIKGYLSLLYMARRKLARD